MTKITDVSVIRIMVKIVMIREIFVPLHLIDYLFNEPVAIVKYSYPISIVCYDKI